MKSTKTLMLAGLVLMACASTQAMAGQTSHITPTQGQDTRMGRTTGNDSITDGTMVQGEVTIHESDEVRTPSSIDHHRN